MLESIIFYSFGFLTLVSALGVVFFKKLLHAVLCLMITLLGVAVLFLFAGAEFVAVSQIMIYTGGILILIIFGLMLTSQIGSNQSNENNSNFKLSSLIVFSVFGFFGYKLIFGEKYISQQILSKSPIKQIGMSFLTQHLFTFEAITILLTIALIGAAVISKSYIKHDK